MSDIAHDPATPGADPAAADRRQQINQQNAQHSTGPRTPEGKAASSWNAMRHGLRSNRDVLPGIESQEEWDQFRADFLAELAPVGVEETRLALRVVRLHWRLQRVERFETEAFARDLDPEGGAGLPLEKAIALICRYEGHISRELRQARQALEGLQKARRTRERTEKFEKEGGTAGVFARLGQEVKKQEEPAPAPTPSPFDPPPPGRRMTAAEIKAELKRVTGQVQELKARGTAPGPQAGAGSSGKQAPSGSDASGSVGSIGRRPGSEAPGSASPPA